MLHLTDERRNARWCCQHVFQILRLCIYSHPNVKLFLTKLVTICHCFGEMVTLRLLQPLIRRLEKKSTSSVPSKAKDEGDLERNTWSEPL